MKYLRELFILRWRPGKDLVVVALSCLLVIGSLYTAMVIVTPAAGGGLPYFFIYAGLTATLFGIGIPVGWMVVVRKRPLADLGLHRKWLWRSIVLQLIFAGVEYFGGLSGTAFPTVERFLPLLALSLTIGFFEAVFWRGWVFMRLEEAFGFFPAALLGAALYAVYHIGYAMPISEIIFLFFIGLMYIAVFRLTRSVFILWPVFQPVGQLITLFKDGLELPVLASLGFLEVLILMVVIIWLAGRYLKRVQTTKSHPAQVRVRGG